MIKCINKIGSLLSSQVWWVGFLTLTLAGCTVLQRPPSWDELRHPRVIKVEASSSVEGVLEASFGLAWWESFQDPQLQNLLQRALEKSLTVQLALDRLKIAKSYVDEKRASYWAGGLSSTVGLQHQPNPIPPGNLTKMMGDWVAQATYQVDLPGGISASIGGAQTRVDSSVADLEGVTLTLISNITTTYLKMCASQVLIDRSIELRNLLEQELALTRSLEEVGLLNGADAESLALALEDCEQSLIMQEKSLEAGRVLLGYLIGGNTPLFELELSDQWEPLASRPCLPKAIPAVWVLHRSDVRQAYLDALAAGYDQKQAQAALWPSISLESSLGGISRLLRNFFDFSGQSWQIGVQFLTPLWNRPALSAQYRTSQLTRSMACHTYQDSILNAFQEVGQALVSFEKDSAIWESTSRQIQTLQRTKTRVEALYNAQLVDRRSLIEAQRSLIQGEVQGVEARLAVLLDEAQVYLTLGVGLPSS